MMKRTPRSADANFQCGFAESLDQKLLDGVRKNVEEVWISLVDEEWILAFHFTHYYPETVDIDKYDRATLFSTAVLIPRC